MNLVIVEKQEIEKIVAWAQCVNHFNYIYIGPFHNKCEMFYMRHSAKLTIAFGRTVS